MFASNELQQFHESIEQIVREYCSTCYASRPVKPKAYLAKRSVGMKYLAAVLLIMVVYISIAVHNSRKTAIDD